MSGHEHEHSDDSSGNLAARDTVQDFTADSARSRAADPNDTQQDPLGVRNQRANQNITNDPDTVDNQSEIRNLPGRNAFAVDVTKEDPNVGDRKGFANPRALDKTLLEPHAQQVAAGSEQRNLDTTTDLLNELFQSAIMANAGSASGRAGRGNKAPEKAVHRNPDEELFDGRFQLLSELGAGGMGTVLKAHDWELDRIVAIKVLTNLGRDADARMQRFRQEARAAAKVSHPNLLKIHDLHTAVTGERYIQFEYVEGCSLANLLDGFEQKRLLMPLKTVLECAIQSLDALDCMHEHNIVHRDVKPGNIMLEKKTNALGSTNSPGDGPQDGARTAKLNDNPDADYHVKLVDFGLAKIRDQDDNTMMSITRKGQAVGTAAYMSPEQCAGERVDGRSDIYSLGCILFEMLTGHVPFRGADSAETMRLHLNAAIPVLRLARPDLLAVDEFERIVNRMLAKERIDRYQKAAQAKDDLKQLYIGIKSGAIMEALQSEKGKYVTNSQSLPSEVHPGVPRGGGTDGGLENLQAMPGAFDPTIPDLNSPQTQNKQNAGTSTQVDAHAEPHKAERKIYADPLAPDATVQDGFSQGRKVYPDPLADTQPSVSSPANAGDSKRAASAGSINTNWDPVENTPGVSSSSKQSTPVKKKTGQGFSEGDLFARKYEIKGHIGQGGMGVVYKALDLILGRTVAIKFLKGKSGISQMEMSRFQQEAKAIASLDHTNIIRVHDMSVTDDGDPFFVLEYLEGHALSSELRGKKQLPLERALSIVSQVCDALDHAHEKGVIHRDIKPSNLMIVPLKDGTDHVKLLDFGIAKLNPIDEETILKLTKTGELFGSPHYMSPEQCSGKEIGGPSDIYSLGVVLFELICGVPPFSGQSPFDTLDKHKNAPTPSVLAHRPDLPASEMIDDLLDKMMAKDPSDRYQSPKEVKIVADEILKTVQVSPSPSMNVQVPLRGDAKRAALIATCTVVILGLVFVSFNIFGHKESSNTVAPVSNLRSWKTYDLKGQRLFNLGSYTEAEKQFLLAREAAQSENSAKGRLNLFTSMQELRMLYTATGNTEKIEWANSQLLNLREDKTLIRSLIIKPKFSWDDITRQTVKARSAAELDLIVEMARTLVVNAGNTQGSKMRLRELRSLRKNIAVVPNSEFARDQIVLLEGLQYISDGIPLPEETRQVIAKYLSLPPETMSPRMANVLVRIAIDQVSIDPRSLEGFSQYAIENSELPDDRIVALYDLSKIYWCSNRIAAAKPIVERCILEAQKQAPPRDYFRLMCALTMRGELYDAEQNFTSAIPRYQRAIAIARCTNSMSSGIAAIDNIRGCLAKSYIGIQKYDEAEKILLGLAESSNPTTILMRANWLRQLGILYLKRMQVDKAEYCFAKSVEIYKSRKSLDRTDAEEYRAVVADLKRVRSMRELESDQEAKKPALKNQIAD